MKNNNMPTIKDSGDRREFGTGAQRDMGGNKGRFDLMPSYSLLRLAKHYEAGAEKYQPRNWEYGIPIGSFLDSAQRHIHKYQDGWVDEDHLAAAAWNILNAMWTEKKRPQMQDMPERMGLEDPFI